MKIDETDELPIHLIQDNNLVCEDVYAILKEVDIKDKKKHRSEYTLKFMRDFVPRFYLEDYITKVVVKDASENYVLDFYCSKYPRQFNEKRDKAFLSEVKKIISGNIKSDIIDFQKVSWVTSNAWGMDDWMHYVFADFEFYDIIEFDGHYIFRFGCQSELFADNLLDKIYSNSANEKYKTKAKKKSSTIQIFKPEKEKYEIPSTIDLNNIETIDFYGYTNLDQLETRCATYEDAKEQLLEYVIELRDELNRFIERMVKIVKQ